MEQLVGEVTIEELMSQDEWLAVDVRSPSEYAEDTIPGAVNIPLLGDAERELVGTVYHQNGPAQARRLGLEMVAPRLSGMVDAVEKAAVGRSVVVFCWRGGLRSSAVSRVLALMGIRTMRLTGGYKSFRQYVLEFFSRSGLPQPLTVLHGLTGVGKTEVIRHLREMGVPVIDLEGLANHRGSVFGHIGLGAQPTQKTFETRLFAEFQKLRTAHTIVVECESRRIGRLFLPDVVVEGIRQGERILVYDSPDGRVRRVISDYTVSVREDPVALPAALDTLRKRLNAKKLRELTDAIAAGDYAVVVTGLLQEYYDPLYGYPDAPAEGYQLCVDAGQPQRAAREIACYLANAKP